MGEVLFWERKAWADESVQIAGKKEKRERRGKRHERNSIRGCRNDGLASLGAEKGEKKGEKRRMRRGG